MGESDSVFFFLFSHSHQSEGVCALIAYGRATQRHFHMPQTNETYQCVQLVLFLYSTDLICNSSAK